MLCGVDLLLGCAWKFARESCFIIVWIPIYFSCPIAVMRCYMYRTKPVFATCQGVK